MKELNTRQRIEAGVALGIVALLLILGFTGVFSEASFFRVFVGLGFGYALTRGDYGFAGLANKTQRTGKGDLFRALLLMFVVSAGIVGAFMVGGKVGVTAKPLSWGLLIGGIIFGVGMAFASCCASGSLQDTAAAFTRAIVVIVFFGLGVVVAWPLMSKGFVTNSILGTSSDGVAGVSFVDWFSKGGTNLTSGVFGAMIVTILLALGFAYLAKLYEDKVSLKLATNCEVEKASEPKVEEVQEESLWHNLFVKKWSLTRTALVISVLFGLLYARFSGGWGASDVHGAWFSGILRLFGVSADKIVDYTGRGGSVIRGSFFEHAMSWQNIGIILGAFVNLLLMGTFTKVFKDGLKVKPLELVLFAIGGILMGVGSRLAMGCNLGGLYTPIANFSLSGWFYLVFAFVGAFGGNYLRKLYYDNLIDKK